MSTIEAGVRGGAIAVLLLLALFAWRDGRHLPAGRYSALFMICAACFLVEAAPGPATSSALWILPFRELSVVGPAIFLVWARATFHDSFRPSWTAWLPPAGLAGLGVWAMVTDTSLAWQLVHIVSLVLVGIGVWHVLAGRSGDLVEARRRLRPVLAIGAGLASIVFILLAALASQETRAHASLVTASIVLVLAVTAAITRLGLRSSAEFVAVPGAGMRLDPLANVAVALDPEERTLLDRLRRLMEEDRIYREEGLGIAVLAARLGLPEYRLRRLINQRLGHRNFSSFVNGYRLTEAIAALADPAQAQVPVLTIALDAGFQSIGPFNRAFRAQTGTTPTDFRREKLERTVRAAE
jgi:AraC-like DNA-binding protein